jgi:thiol-disulfide isomerase/thioredoxin
MTMNLKNIIGLLLMLPASFSMAQDKFEISGKLNQKLTDKIVVLSYKNVEGKDVKDSAVVNKGQFLLKGITAFANKAYLTLTSAKRDTAKRRPAADYKLFYLEKGKYKVVGTDSISKSTITGTPAQNDFMEYTAQMGDNPARFQDVSQRFAKIYYAKDKDTVEIKRLQAEAKPIYARMESILDSFIFSHPDSYVALDLIAEQKTAVIDPVVFEKYYKPLSKRVLSSFNGQKLTVKYDKAKQIAIGKSVDFTQLDDKGKEFKLSSYKGKYVLVDFWASWCAPCRAENPNLLKAYKELKEKNFEIVGVSLDDSKAAWLNAVQKDGMPWMQVSDLKGFKTEVAVKYGISAIPQNFLINPEGVIIAKNLRGEQLTEELKKFIK